MLLGFKKRFVPLIQNGSKCHTIRAKGGVGRRPGAVCHCYTGLRQKGAQLIGRWVCTRIEDIVISIQFFADGYFCRLTPTDISVKINGCGLSPSEIEQLCWVDGFRDPSMAHWKEFSLFWLKEHGKNMPDDNRIDFAGDLIHWDYDQPVEVKPKETRKAAIKWPETGGL